MNRTYIPKAIRDEIERLSRGCCEYCKYLQMYSPSKFANEHIIPLVLGGTNELSNLAKACSACNSSKYTAINALDPETNETVPLFHPRKDNWEEHFQWSDDLLEMEGLTPIGRATILRLKTNRPEIVNLRRVLIGLGHPPSIPS